LGNALIELVNRASAIIQEAEAASRGIIAAAGAEVRLSVQSAQQAYDDEMNRTVDKLDAAARGQLNQLTGAVTDLASNVETTAKQAAASAQQVALTLPFANRAAQVRQYAPHFWTRAVGAGPLALQVDGVFAFAQQPGFTPTLRVGTETLTPQTNTTQQLRFHIPRSALSAAQQATVVFTQASLTVPWESGELVKKRKESTFLVPIGTLPDTPGVFSLKNTSPGTTIRTIPVTTPVQSLHIDPPACSGRIAVASESPPDPTAQIDYTSYRENYIQENNISPGGFTRNSDWELVETQRFVRWVQARNGREIGFGDNQCDHVVDVKLTLSYNWLIPARPEQTVVETLTVAWGQQVARDIGQTWQLTYQYFDGVAISVANQPWRDDRYGLIKVDANARNITISATDPQTSPQAWR